MWYRCFRRCGLQLAATDTMEDWWLGCRKIIQKKDRRLFDTVVAAGCWELWKQRNARAFNNINMHLGVMEFVAKILDEVKLWIRVRGVGVGDPSIARE